MIDTVKLVPCPCPSCQGKKVTPYFRRQHSCHYIWPRSGTAQSPLTASLSMGGSRLVSKGKQVALHSLQNSTHWFVTSNTEMIHCPVSTCTGKSKDRVSLLSQPSNQKWKAVAHLKSTGPGDLRDQGQKIMCESNSARLVPSLVATHGSNSKC